MNEQKPKTIEQKVQQIGRVLQGCSEDEKRRIVKAITALYEEAT
jgi:hypothetical protein